MSAGTFAAVGIALYAAHHVGDYWIQTDDQAQHKGDAGPAGRIACASHVITYVATQAALVGALTLVDVGLSATGFLGMLAVSGITHYLADRRARGLMIWLAKRMGTHARFVDPGTPRAMLVDAGTEPGARVTITPIDNPTLGTGAWALDQSWHIFWGVFVAALIGVTL